nr:unnamed protein product [Callosobruchus chinensis]
MMELKDYGGYTTSCTTSVVLLRIILEGTDITEAFESHHMSAVPSYMLSQYLVRNATTPRNSPFTFHENGFYKSLRRKVQKKLKTLPKNLADRSKYMTDLLFASYIGKFLLFAKIAVI